MGCRVCRARKVKCDGRPNGCRNCERLQLECVGENGLIAASNGGGGGTSSISAASTSPSHARSATSPISLRKIRTYRSCTACRVSKTKCDGGRPNCARCTAKKLTCVYDGGAAPRWTRNLNRDGTAAAVKGDDDEGGDAVMASGERDSQNGSGESGESGEGDSPPVGSQKGDAVRSTSASQGHVPSFSSGVPRNVFKDAPDSLSWLLAPELPSPRHIRRLVEHYFSNIHPIRCFAFVHKPSFMRQLDNGFSSDDEAALLHIICAHGAKFHCLSLGQIDQTPHPAFIRASGCHWAKKAESLLMKNYGKVSIQRLMTAVLLYDFHYRLGDYSQALMLSGLAVRMAQALKINTEYSPDILCTEAASSGGSHPSVVSRESRRRLMWAVYVLDAWTGSGVEQLTLLRENDIKIQLPCNERNFGLRIPSVTETLGVGHVLQFLSPAAVPKRPADNMGIMAYYIRIVTLWKRIAKYISKADQGPPPWLPESDFAALDADMGRWRRELPDFVEYSPDTIYARLDSNQLGALVLIHCTYHHSYIELYKVSMPELFRSPAAASLSSSTKSSSGPPLLKFPSEHAELLQALQAECYFHALQVSRLLSEAAEHGTRLLSDSMLPFFVYDSSRVMLYYVARLLNPGRVDVHAKVREALEAVEVNARLLRLMGPLFPVSESLSTTVDRWLLKVRQGSGGGSLIRGTRGSEDGSSVPSVEMTSILGSPTSANQDMAIPPFSLHNTATMSDSPLSDPPPPSRSATSWTAANTTVSDSPPLGKPAGGGEWEHASAAHGLVGLSQHEHSEASESLQHERPVLPSTTSNKATVPASIAAAAVAAVTKKRRKGSDEVGGGEAVLLGDALDLEELQNFLSWDIYGIMDLGETISASGGYEYEDEVRRSDWSSMI